MAYCKHCGAEINDDAAFCPKCGQAQSETAPQQPQQQTPPNWQQPPQTPAPVDSGSIGWGVLGFCIPIVGLILFLVWKDQKPRTAKMAGIGALVSVIIAVVCYVLMFIILGVGMSMM